MRQVESSITHLYSTTFYFSLKIFSVLGDKGKRKNWNFVPVSPLLMINNKNHSTERWNDFCLRK